MFRTRAFVGRSKHIGDEPFGSTQDQIEGIADFIQDLHDSSVELRAAWSRPIPKSNLGLCQMLAHEVQQVS